MYWLAHFVEFYKLNYVDFGVLVEIEGSVYIIEKVWYHGFVTDSFENLKQQYDLGRINKQRVPYPNDDNALLSKM